MKRRDLLTATAGGLSWLVTQALAETQSQTSLREKEKAIEPLLKELEAMRGRFSNVPHTDGQFLNMLVKLSRSKRVLEVGTSNGYSAIWLCLALEETDGHLTTIEIDPERVKLAKENLKRAGLKQRVTFLEGENLQGQPVTVIIQTNVPTIFARFLGVSSIQVTAQASAPAMR